MGFKVFVIIIFFGVVTLGIYYMSHLVGTGPAAPCPAGSRYVRAVTGGWADTDPTDRWGRCIPESEINATEGK